jgi:shikimate dehydrogenase
LSTIELAVIGHPIAHSLSPLMHGAAIAALGIDASYRAIDIAPRDLAAEITAMRARGMRGLNVTLPHKETIGDLLDEVDDEARAIGAVNTVVIEGARWIGTNTDARGLLRSLVEGGVDPHGARVVILGAGGAARAAAFGMAGAGAARVTIAARSVERASALGRDLALALGAAGTVAITDLASVASLERDLAGCDLLIQATSATLDPDAGRALVGSLPLDALPRSSTVVDLVYRPRRTALIAAADARGLRTVDGVGMLVHQGALALERWLGIAAPIDVMRRAALGAL